MTSKPEHTVTEAAGTIDGLEHGKEYHIQYWPQQENVEYLEYCNYATDPTAEAVSWLKLHPLKGPDGFITTGKYDTADKLWLRVPNFDMDASVDTAVRISVTEA